MNTQTKNLIAAHLTTVMNRVIQRRTITEPFNEEELLITNPFGAPLVPIEIWKGAKFERSFVTSLGQGIFEQLAKIIAQGTGAYAANQHDTHVSVTTNQNTYIEDLLTKHRNNTQTPNWSQEERNLLSINTGQMKTFTVRSDLYIRRTNGKEEFYSLKTVKPNLDQTQHAKRDMLLLKANDPTCETYFVLPYNPAGEGGSYRKVHSIPYKIFQMDSDPVVLIGSEFWNKVGNDSNTYTELLEIFEAVGRISSNRIRREYLGL